MNVTGTNGVQIKPGLPGEIIPSNTYSNIWVMHYFKGGSPNQIKNFVHVGDFRSALNTARDFCTKMGYRLMYVKPFISDLDAEVKTLTSEQNVKTA